MWTQLLLYVIAVHCILFILGWIFTLERFNWGASAMVERPRLLETESAVFAGGNTPILGAHQQYLEEEQSIATCVRSPEMDKHLEHTLTNINLAEPLTKRETEVLQWVVSGKTNKEIARILCRTERTVEYHRNRLMRKVGAHSAADLVKRAILMGVM
jgi:DNA-binding NarL/FixJ family response regulator